MAPRPDINTVITKAAPCVQYFTPAQPAPAGQLRSGRKNTKLFTPLKIRNLQLANRIGVSPMCTYSAEDGVATDWHLAHYGQYAMRGPSLVMVESVATSPEGRITPHCLGIYGPKQKSALKRIVDFYHTQKKPIGIQLCHAGYRASCLPLYYDAFDYPVTNDRGGWLDEVKGPSRNSSFPYAKELTEDEVTRLVQEFKEAIRASVEIGFDVIEIHAAHGFLINQFLSPLGNRRTDKYGGNFDSRCQFLKEVIDVTREVREDTKTDFPIWVRISASDNDESNPDSWRVADSIELAPKLVEWGVDVIDVSSGGMSESKPPHVSQSDMAHAVKKVVGESCIVTAVGGIRTGQRAEELLEKKYCDMCLSGRQFLKDPGMVENWADELGVKIQMNLQDGWCFNQVWDEDDSKL